MAVIFLGVAGLGAWRGYIDYVVLPLLGISYNFGGVEANSDDGHTMRGARVVIETSNPVPFVVSLSNHEWHTLKFLTLRQAQGERVLSKNV